MSLEVLFLTVVLLLLATACAVGFTVQWRRRQRLELELIQERRQGELAQEELKDAYHHLRDLGRHLLALQEEERGRIATRIHDELGQALTAISLDVSWIESQQPKVSPDVKERFAGLKQVLGTTLILVRRLAAELKPRILEESGLAAAMEWQIQDQCKRAGLESSFSSEVPNVKGLLPDLAKSLFRDLQELLANVVRHANAEMVVVTLAEHGNDLVLSVADDGRGFDQANITAECSFGFLQVRDRARYWGGTVEVSNQNGGGAVVEVRVPTQRT